MRKLFLSFLLGLMVPMAAGAQEPYAVLSDNGTVLTFYYDDQKAESNGMDVGPFTCSWDDERQRGVINSGWDNQRKDITSVVFHDSFAGCTTLTSTAWWFYGFSNLSSITGIGNLKTDNVTDMSGMFYECYRLKSLDVTGFKTDNVTNMYQMFCECASLTSLDVTGFKTDNVTNMYQMFYNCWLLTSLDLSGFKTDNVYDMGEMFAYSWGLTSLDVTGFKTDNVMNMNGMFYRCSNLTSLDLTGFKTDNVTRMDGMFYGCSSLTSLDLSGFNTDNVTNMSSMFYSCAGLTSLDITGFKTDNVTNMGSMFAGCTSLTTIYADDGWSTAKVQDSKEMFSYCLSLVGGAGTKYDGTYTDHTYARIDGGSDNPGYFTRKAGDTGDWAEGDLNHDGKVDAADVVTLVNIIKNQK